MSAEYFQAAVDGDLATLQRCVEVRGVDVNAQGALNRTALHAAALNGRVECLLFLLEHGAKLDVRGSSGETPLQCAALNNHVECAELLLEAGADFAVPNPLSGKRPDQYARKPEMRRVFDEARQRQQQLLQQPPQQQPLQSQRQQQDQPPPVPVLAGAAGDDHRAQQAPPQKLVASNQLVVERLVSMGYALPAVLETLYDLRLRRRYEDAADANMVAAVLASRPQLPPAPAAAAQAGAAVAADESNLCKICFGNVVDTVILPCAHSGLCLSCAQNERNTRTVCPFCRQHIVDVVKIWQP